MPLTQGLKVQVQYSTGKNETMKMDKNREEKKQKEVCYHSLAFDARIGSTGTPCSPGSPSWTSTARFIEKSIGIVTVMSSRIL